MNQASEWMLPGLLTLVGLFAKRQLDDAAIAAARLKLRSAVDRQRIKRTGEDALMRASGHPDDFLPSEFAVAAWQQADSFIAPLDSRRGKLQ
jgi:hypothetical protein